MSPDGKYVVTANFLSSTITILDTKADKVVKSLPCEPGCHGANFGLKKGGGYYAYVASKFANVLDVVDMDKLDIVGRIPLDDPKDGQITPPPSSSQEQASSLPRSRAGSSSLPRSNAVPTEPYCQPVSEPLRGSFFLTNSKVQNPTLLAIKTGSRSSFR